MALPRVTVTDPPCMLFTIAGVPNVNVPKTIVLGGLTEIVGAVIPPLTIAVPMLVELEGVYSSADARASLPELVPPATSTLPLGRSVAV